MAFSTKSEKCAAITGRYTSSAYLREVSVKGIRLSMFSGILNSQMAQVEADRVYNSLERYLYKDGRMIHFKKYTDIRTTRPKQATGVIFDKNTLSVKIGKVTIPIRYKEKLTRALKHDRYNDDILYKLKALESEIMYTELKRLEFKDGYHYYVNIYFNGEAPLKHAYGDGVCGIDPGVSSAAVTGENGLMLRELAPLYGNYNNKIRQLLIRTDRLRRASNPDHYNPDGTVKKAKGRRRWVKTRAYNQLLRRLRVLYRRKAAYIKQSHEELANDIIATGDTFYFEKMSFKGLQ